MKNKKYIVVTPVYEDKEASTRLFTELAGHFNNDLYVVAVDDGSVKNPLGIDAIESAGLEGAVIKLKRNVGHQRAIAIGLGHVSEIMDDDQIVITMDSDGEDTPQSIKELIQPLSQNDIDVVVAQRKSRVETLKFKIFYVFYKFIFSLLSGRKISFGNFMAFKKKAVKRLVNMQDLGIHVAGTVLSSKLRISLCPLDRGARYAGQSKMNFVGLVLHGFKGLMVFAEDVLVRVGIASAVVASLSVLSGLCAVMLKLAGIATPGWFSVAIGILFLVFLQTGTMTLMMLMLTGVVKNRGVEPEDYQTFVDEVVYAKK
ncbi:glycosyl transferase [Vibrio cholerae]|uniref:glycosyltransferase n=1 Tax=Vibrio cholerae TaxID=666 RepID=UPI0011D7AA4A|nr:glycosyltransferase [Vibrio cholerae]EGR2496920.1 glycosyltransferase [Vibrio cholerae]EGR2520215.1 glycosyltransferase [Vibrio cholerae]TXZ49445.1 glycosyltransferase [Vibrio cholerae]BCN20175.1 putative glycosyltransferase [Vibrio cholerae]BCN20835.1 putative glycosyltransferase [Vibrio cholerae]